MDNINLLKAKNLPLSLEAKVSYFTDLYKKDATFRLRELSVERNEKFKCALVFFDGMVDTEKLNNGLIRPLLTTSVNNTQGSLIEYVEKQILFNNEVSKSDSLYDLIGAINLGDTVILLENEAASLIVNTKGWRTRGISEPQDERILQGPREGFDEALMLNAAMLRRKLSTPDLCFERLIVGRKTQTNIFVCYLSSVAKPETVN